MALPVAVTKKDHSINSTGVNSLLSQTCLGGITHRFPPSSRLTNTDEGRIMCPPWHVKSFKLIFAASCDEVSSY
jgi:hypothetical protein